MKSNHHIAFSTWFACTGFRWLPSPYNECNLFAMAKETYIDYQPDTDIYHTLFINKNGMESKTLKIEIAQGNNFGRTNFEKPDAVGPLTLFPFIL
jgi:hypothetical protein